MRFTAKQKFYVWLNKCFSNDIVCPSCAYDLNLFVSACASALFSRRNKTLKICFCYSARWIGNHGFSIGINDVQPGDVLNKEKKATLDKEYGHCTDYIKSYTSGSLELLPGCDKAETLEAKITGTLNNIRETTANVRFYLFSGIYDHWLC